MTNIPLCQFGPGGDYVTVWPDDSEPLAQENLQPTIADVAREMGMEPPLVSVGPEGIQWHKRGIRVIEALKTLLSRKSSRMAPVRLVERQAAPAVPRTVAERSAAPAIILERSAAMQNLAMPAEQGTHLAAGQGLVFVSGVKETEHAYNYAETDGDSSLHTGFSEPSGLFAVNAGDRGSFESHKGHGLRARRSTRKKGSSASRDQTQRSLFASIS